MTQARIGPNAAIPLRYANRHGLITGPTGTGKTVTIMRLAESFAQQGVPVFAPDVKGDLAALARSCQATFFQPLTGPGAPCRVPVWAFGADLLSRALELTDAQAGALEIAFAHADESGAPLDTLADFRNLLAAVAANPESVAHLGHVTRASIGTIQRALLRLEGQGAGHMFGAPALDVADLMQPGLVSILDASEIYHAPRLYGALLLYVLRELARRLPECGDMDRPRLVLIFDEAHTVFHEAPPALLRQVEATARLIRSKGVGLYFASQSSDDIPAIVQAQCATRIEHSRDYGVGRARFATLDANGRPTAPRMVAPDLPECPLGPLSDAEAARYVPDVAQTAPPDVAQTAPPEDMTGAGCAFLVVAVLAFVYGLSAALAAWGAGGTLAVAFGVWLGLKKYGRLP